MEQNARPIVPMTLGNMRQHGVRSLVIACSLCRHEAVISAEPWPDSVPVPTFGPRMVCTDCGIIDADARPNWRGRMAPADADQRRALALLATLNQPHGNVPRNATLLTTATFFVLPRAFYKSHGCIL